MTKSKTVTPSTEETRTPQTAKQRWVSAKHAAISRTVDVAFAALFGEALNGYVPAHFVLETESRSFRIGKLHTASPSDVSVLADVKWQGTYPLYIVSLICPCLHLAGHGANEHWTLLRTSVFCTDKSRGKLAVLRSAVANGVRSQTWELGDIISPFMPEGCAVAQDSSHRSKDKIWLGLPEEYRAEARKWCDAQALQSVIQLRGLEVRQVFSNSMSDGDLEWKTPRIEVHKLL